MPSESPTSSSGHASFVEQLRHRIIIRRERGDFFAAPFHGADGFGGDFDFVNS